MSNVDEQICLLEVLQLELLPHRINDLPRRRRQLFAPDQDTTLDVVSLERLDELPHRFDTDVLLLGIVDEDLL